MPRNVLEFRIVIASPADVFNTRRAAFDGLHELNRTFETQKISIKALGWEEYATPGAATETQEVINKQLLVEYDILIAIFGTKLGTPTQNYCSGTVEEIERAIENTTNVLGQARVQIYFLDKIESASSISIDELKRVADFRNELGQRGILYRLFKDDGELQKEIRVNVQRTILEYLNKNPRSLLGSTDLIPPKDPPINQEILEAPAPQTDDMDAGLLDIQEVAEEAIEAVTVAINRITDLINEITAEMNIQTAEIEKFSIATTKDKKKIINDFAAFIEERATSVEQEAFVAREKFDLFSQNVVLLAALQRRDGDSDRYKEELAVLLETVEQMLQSLPQVRANIGDFKMAISNLPRITIQFNRSKKLLLRALDECTQFFDQTERSIYEIAGST